MSRLTDTSSTNNKISYVPLKLKLIYDRQSVGQSVPVSGTHLGPATNFFFLVEISFRQMRVCYFVAPSLTRGRVCNLPYNCFWAFARAVTLRSKSRRTHGLILLSHLRLPQPGGPDPRIYIPQERGGPVKPPGTGFPFCCRLRFSGLRWRYCNPPPRGSSYVPNTRSEL
jgi:hypothetical protein